ncbi:cytochrome P450 [Kitasatospora purpeofusca]|uniref:cytochrome P450 n=1 Tax=Kitasatospora purpeofusca TaxID=67352 RepID=UPI002A5A6EDE|nr:cytochrome P450 [Kitasatospora purpeofusca]MDY0816507.1 cytochrome P450 [Kitasatospora purpeofusca]
MSTPTAPVTLIPARHDTACPFAPPPAYTEAAGTGPVSRAELPDGSPCWLVTGYQEVRTVLSDRRFSADARRPAFPFLTEGRRELVAANPSFLRLDDPEHARLRRMVTGDFLVKRVEEMRPGIQQIVDEALDRMIARGGPAGPADLVADFALPVPSLVICLLLGVPYEDREAFQANSRLLLTTEADDRDVARAQDELLDYLGRLAERKRTEPGDDILSRLVAREDLSPREIASTGVLLLVAGHETTANMIGLSTALLLRHPEQVARLADPAAVPGAVEELLRLLTIVHTGVPRLALEDVELGGTLIRAGDGVMAMLSTANRDDGLFGSEGHLGVDEVDLDREARRHVSFGFGVHQCLGQPLARAELQIALATLFRRLPGLRLAVPEEELEFRTEALIYGLGALPVRW